MKNYKLYRGAWVVDSHPHCSLEIDKKKARALLNGGGYIVRNIFDFDCQQKTEFWYIIKDTYGGIEELPTKVRNQVKRSLNSYDFRRLTKDQMLDVGPELFNKSRERFGVRHHITLEEWNIRLNVHPNLDFWVGFSKENGMPASFSINTLFDDYCDYNTMGISPEVQNSTYPMYGLIFEMNRYYLQELRLKYVMDGARSITEHSNIQPFLEEKFKFRKAYCDIKVFYKWWLGIAVKILFPFRKWIKNGKISAILRQEAWVRGMEQ